MRYSAADFCLDATILLAFKTKTNENVWILVSFTQLPIFNFIRHTSQDLADA